MSGTSSNPTWLLAASRRRTSYSGLRISDAERADVLRGIETYRRQGAEHEARFQELYRALPPRLQVLEGASASAGA